MGGGSTISTSTLSAGAVAAAATAATWSLRSRAPGGRTRWHRTNHAGGSVSLVEGPAWAVGAVVGVLTAPRLKPAVRWGAALATAGSAALGAVDDLAGSSDDKGLRGHLGALARGRLTTGGAKVIGIGTTALVAAWPLLADDRATRRRRGGASMSASLGDAAVAGALVAGMANLGNLLDLRPGRVLKLVLATAPLARPLVRRGAPATQGQLLRAAAAGASVAVLPADLGEQAMLGDCGANAAGALLGSALVASTAGHRRGRASRAAALALVVALTLASERVSFTRVIETTPVLRELDAAGRRTRPARR